MATKQSNSKGAVLITGASAGIGAITAQYLNDLGYQVFAGVRKLTDGEALKRKSSGLLTPMIIDVTDAASITKAVQIITSNVGESGLQALINNAGMIVEGAIEIVPIEDLRQQFEVNVFGQVAVTQAFLPLLRQGQGRIINISAVTAKVSIPLLGPISASKAALESLTDALRIELRAWNIPVSIIEPAAMRTEIFNKSAALADVALQQSSSKTRDFYRVAINAMRAANAKAGVSDPIVVVKAIAQALTARNPKTRYVVGKGAGTLLTLRLLSARTRDGILFSQMGLAKASKAGEVKTQHSKTI